MAGVCSSHDKNCMRITARCVGARVSRSTSTYKHLSSRVVTIACFLSKLSEPYRAPRFRSRRTSPTYRLISLAEGHGGTEGYLRPARGSGLSML